jgi:O-antigen ligase
MIAAMNYLGSKRNIFSEKYMNFVILAAYLNIFLSGTRGLIIALTIGLIIFALFVDNRFFLRLRFLPVMIIVVVLALTVPVFQNQLDAVLFRANTMTLLAAGDISAGKSTSRIDKYSPPVINKFLEFPIFGWGFSDEARATANNHVGMPTLLMQVGVVGFLFITYFWWKLFSVPISINKKLSNTNPYKKGLLALTVALLIILIIHSTSGQQFSYMIGFYGSSIAQLLYYSYSDVLIKSAVSTEYELSTTSNIQLG